jgi:putative oxygen-independent coproporphyrinogen III oxidase
LLTPPPLSLYVHLPWCIRKCPYCDFNSHALGGELPADDYIEALLADLQNDLPLVWGRPVSSIYFGGGTPSLFNASQVDTILGRIRGLLQLTPDVEITLEANPGTIEHDSFTAYRQAGINRVSLGAQSFDDHSLGALGRIHASDDIQRSVDSLHTAGIANFNIDLMYGLPDQSVDLALADIARAIECDPAHISHYQLTLEPNTLFAARPPDLPNDDVRWEMQEACSTILADAGYDNYEISAWSQPGKACRHNLNYWRFGDYLGIGAGAHGKLTLAAGQKIIRITKQKHPARFLAALGDSVWRMETRELDANSLVFEYFLNHLRLAEPIALDDFERVTGLSRNIIESPLEKAVEKGLLEVRKGRVEQTALGRRFNNDLQAVFLV